MFTTQYEKISGRCRDGMSRGLHHPYRELFEKSSVYIAKQSNSRPTKKKNRKATKSKLLKPRTLTSPIYWIPQQTLTFPRWVSVFGPLSSQWKWTKWVSLPWRKTEKGRPCMMVERTLLLEQFKSNFTQKDLQNLPFFHKPPDVVNRLTDNRY